MTTVATRELGRTGMRVSQIGLGCAGFWGRPQFSQRKALRVVEAAMESGINYLDTGVSYACGEAERRLGRAIRGVGAQDIVISTKAGTRCDERKRLVKDFTPRAILRSVEDSLRNLMLEAIPLLHLHGPRVEDVTPDLISQLERLKEDGLVRCFSINSYQPGVVEELSRIELFDCVMLDYSILCQDRAPLIARLHKRGVGVIAGSALANGLVDARFFRPRRASDLWYIARSIARFRQELKRARRFRFLRDVPGWTATQISLAYVLNNPHISSAVFGTTNVNHLRLNVAASNKTIDPEVVEAINRAGATQ